MPLKNVLACTLILLTGAACVGGATPAVIAVDGLKMVRNLPILLADRQGYFRDAGLDVTFKETSAGPETDAMLVDGCVAGMAAYYHHTIVAQMEEHEAVEA